MTRFRGLLASLIGLALVSACIPIVPPDPVPATNQAPVIVTNGNQLVTELTEVELDASATTDPDGDPMTFQWSQLTGPSVTLSGADTAKATFQAPAVPADTVLTFQVLVTDDREGRSAAIVTITVQMAVLPHANAGNDVTTSPDINVMLQGSSSGSPSPVTYRWRQTAGPDVLLTNADTASPNFVAPAVTEKTTLTFELTATDERGGSSTDTVDVTVARRIRFKTTMGDFVMELRGDKAPVTVTNILTYVTEGFYVGLTIHRILPVETDPNDFGGIVQGGGWDPNLNSPPRHDPIVLESNNGLQNVRGAVAMARTSQPNTATSEFYVDVDDNLDLDYIDPNHPGYAVFGSIVEGMDVIDAMSIVPTTSRVAPWNPAVTFYDVPVTPIIINEVLLE